MKGIKALKCYISKEMPPLHILFIKENFTRNSEKIKRCILEKKLTYA